MLISLRYGHKQEYIVNLDQFNWQVTGQECGIQTLDTDDTSWGGQCRSLCSGKAQSPIISRVSRAKTVSVTDFANLAQAEFYRLAPTEVRSISAAAFLLAENLGVLNYRSIVAY